MNYYVLVRSSMTEESLIISDEFAENAAASKYRSLLIEALFDKIRFASFEDVSTWLGKAFVIEVIEAESHIDIHTKGFGEAFHSIHEDAERVMEFMDLVSSAVEEMAMH